MNRYILPLLATIAAMVSIAGAVTLSLRIATGQGDLGVYVGVVFCGFFALLFIDLAVTLRLRS